MPPVIRLQPLTKLREGVDDVACRLLCAALVKLPGLRRHAPSPSTRRSRTRSTTGGHRRDWHHSCCSQSTFEGSTPGRTTHVLGLAEHWQPHEGVLAPVGSSTLRHINEHRGLPQQMGLHCTPPAFTADMTVSNHAYVSTRDVLTAAVLRPQNRHHVTKPSVSPALPAHTLQHTGHT